MQASGSSHHGIPEPRGEGTNGDKGWDARGPFGGRSGDASEASARSSRYIDSSRSKVECGRLSREDHGTNCGREGACIRWEGIRAKNPKMDAISRVTWA